MRGALSLSVVLVLTGSFTECDLRFKDGPKMNWPFEGLNTDGSLHISIQTGVRRFPFGMWDATLPHEVRTIRPVCSLWRSNVRQGRDLATSREHNEPIFQLRFCSCQRILSPWKLPSGREW